MPKWEIHNKWAAKMALTRETTDFVNHLSDFPEKSQEFIVFCEREGEEIIIQLAKSHDFKMIMKIPKYLQLLFMREKGSEYVKAWYLHYVLDYIRMAPALTAEEVLKRTEDRFEPCQELEAIKGFVIENADEVVYDCRL
jgi:hypothetical protein